MLAHLFLKQWLKITQFTKRHRQSILNQFLKATYFLPSYYKLAELTWQEGLYIDFLQKKLTDKWLRKHLILSNNLFNDGWLIRRVVDFYWFLINLPTHQYNVFFFNAPVFNFLFTLALAFLLFFLVILYMGWIFYGLGLC